MPERRVPGHIELAHTGTLFLDEIATLGLALQSKLLRVLEDRAVTRIGGQTAKKIDFRLITATNENLEEMVQAGRFREDLYYRINVVPILLPPLRERQGDIPLLVDHFLRIYCAANNVPLKRLDPEVMQILEEDEWPGNVRELREPGAAPGVDGGRAGDQGSAPAATPAHQQRDQPGVAADTRRRE